MVMNLAARPTQYLVLMLLFPLAVALGGCHDNAADPSSQIGPNPRLPALQQYLLPPMHVASVVGWKQAETPSVAPGLGIKEFATGLEHPRSLYAQWRHSGR